MRGKAALSPAQEVFLVLTHASLSGPNQAAPMPSTPPARPHFALAYNPALDGLRGVAILLVILSHAHAPLFEGAFYGVDLFFVLSGYLITSLLLQELDRTDRINYWRFYRRRLYRLMPALLFFLAAYCLLAPRLWPGIDDVYSDALVSALYLADYGIAFFDQPNTLLHMWSLSVEEHFYLIWPPLLAVLVRRTPRGQLWRAVLGLVVLAWAWRVLWVAQGQQFYEIFFRFDTRATGLLTGALLAALVVEQPRWFQALRARLPHFMWLVLAVPLLMEQAWDDMNAMVWGMSLVEWATALVLVAVLVRRGPVYEMLSARPLVIVGKLSYGIYLWHYPVVRYLRADLPWPAVVVLGFIISTALAALSYYTIERWALRRRDAPPRAEPAGPQGGGSPLAGAGGGFAQAMAARAAGVTAGSVGAQGALTAASAVVHAADTRLAAQAQEPMPHAAVRAPAAAPMPTAPMPMDASLLAMAPVEVPADAPVPVNARAAWPVALTASAYSLAYRVSYGRGAYRFAARHGAFARGAMSQALRKGRAGARTAARSPGHPRGHAGAALSSVGYAGQG